MSRPGCLPFLVLVVLILFSAMFLSACGAQQHNGFEMTESWDTADDKMSRRVAGGYAANEAAPPAMDFDDGFYFGGMNGAAFMPIAEEPMEQSAVATAGVRQAMLIKNATVELQTMQFDDDEQHIRNAVARANGFTERSNVWLTELRGGEQLKRGSFSFRVPSDSFETVLAEIERIGTLRSASSSATDASAEFSDTQGRLEMRRVEEERVLDIMRQAETIADVIQLERRLAEIRSDIEFMQRRLNTISALATYSTIHVELTEVLPDEEDEEEEDAPATVWQRMAASFTGSINFMGSFFSFVLVAASALILPLSLVAAIAGIVLFVVHKAAKKKKN